MSNVLDLLLQVDKNKLKKPTKELEIKRLSDIVGEKIIFTCEAVDIDTYEVIKENATKYNGNGEAVGFDSFDSWIFTVLEGVKSPNLKASELSERYKAATPKELVKKLLLPGEIQKIYEIISDLSGFGEETIEEIKN